MERPQYLPPEISKVGEIMPVGRRPESFSAIVPLTIGRRIEHNDDTRMDSLEQSPISVRDAETRTRKLAVESSLGNPEIPITRQIIGNFARFVASGAEVNYEGDDVRVSSEFGKLKISMPDPTLENMIKAAKILGDRGFLGNDNLDAFSRDLMNLAVLMDREVALDQKIFTSTAIESVYKAGWNLQKILSPEAELGDTSLEAIQAKSHDPSFTANLPVERQRLFMDYFMGRHQLNLQKNGDNWELTSKPEEQNLYDVQFRRWVGRQDPGELQGKTREEIQDLYDSWLLNKENQSRLLRVMAPVVEKSVTNEGKATQKIHEEEERRAVAQNILPEVALQALGPWQEILLETEVGSKLQEEASIAVSKSAPGDLLDQLSEVNKLLQPGETPEFLQYVPAKVLELFQNNEASAEERNAAACVIADVYAKKLLEGQGYNVYTEMLGSHTRLLAVKQERVFEVDPNTPKQVNGKSETGVKEITESEFGKRLLEEASKNAIVRLGRSEDGQRSTVSSGNEALASGFLTNFTAPENEMTPAMKFASAQAAVMVYENNAMAWLLLSQTATDGKNQEYLNKALKLDPDIQTLAKRTENKIGLISIPLGAAGTEYEKIINAAMADLLSNGISMADASWTKFNYDDLEAIRKDIKDAMRNSPTIEPYAQTLLNEVTAAYGRVLQDARAQQERDPSYLTLSGRDRRLIRKDGVMQWFRGKYLRFANRWHPGLDPGGPEYEAFTRQLGEASILLEGQGVDEGFLPGTKNFKEREKFISFQKQFVAAVVAASRLQSIPSGQAGEQVLEDIKSQIKTLGPQGVQLIRELDGGNVGYAATLYKQNLEWERVKSGGYLPTEKVGKVLEDTVNQIMEQTYGGIGNYISRKEELYNQRIWSINAATRPNSPYSSIPLDITKIPYVLAGMTAAEKDKAKIEAREELKSEVQAHVTIGRITDIDMLDESVVLSQGIPHGRNSASPVDLSGRRNPFDSIPNLLRYVRQRRGQTLTFMGTGEASDPIKRRVGPHRYHVVSSTLNMMYEWDRIKKHVHQGGISETGIIKKHVKKQGLFDTHQTHGFTWDPSKMHDDEFIRMMDATWADELFSRSDLMNGSKWRIENRIGIFKEQIPYMVAQNKVMPFSYDDFVLFGRLRATQQSDSLTGADILKRREELLAGNIARYMPEKALQKVFEVNPEDDIFVRFFAGAHHVGAFEGLDRIIVEKLHQPLLPSNSKELAAQRFKAFMDEIEPHLTRFRKTGYDRKIDPATGRVLTAKEIEQGLGIFAPVQRDFRTFTADEARQINSYYSSITGINMANKLQELMNGMTSLMQQRAGERKSDAIATRLAYDPRYLGMYYRTVTDEDFLENIEPIEEKYLSWLGIDTSGDMASRLIGDLKTLTSGADLIIEEVILGNPMEQEKMYEAILKAGHAADSVRGSGGLSGTGMTLLKHGAFVMEASRMGSSDENPLAHIGGEVLNALGLDMRVRFASLYKELRGAQIPGKFDEEQRVFFEKYFKEAIETGDLPKEEAEMFEAYYRAFAHISDKRIRKKLYLKLLMLIFSAAAIQIFKETTKKLAAA